MRQTLATRWSEIGDKIVRLAEDMVPPASRG
jgi:hypothetical protein